MDRYRGVRSRNDVKATIAGLIIKTSPTINIASAKELVKNFIDNFGKEFARVAIEERKALVKKVISEIIADRDRNIVRFYVRRIPAVLPMIDDLMKKERELTKPVSSQRSGGTNILEPTTWIREFEYAL